MCDHRMSGQVRLRPDPERHEPQWDGATGAGQWPALCATRDDSGEADVSPIGGLGVEFIVLTVDIVVNGIEIW